MLKSQNSPEDANLIAKLNALKDRLATLLMQEDQYWKQQAKVHQLKDEDHNTKFFHNMAVVRKIINCISQLHNDSGELVIDQNGLCQVPKLFSQLV